MPVSLVKLTFNVLSAATNSAVHQPGPDPN